MALRIVSWNLNGQHDRWHDLAADGALDVALLQEARKPPVGVAKQIVPEPAGPWMTAGTKPCAWRTAIARLSERVELRPRKLVPVGHWEEDAIPVSREGTITAADLMFGGETVTLVSAYSRWETYSDGSVIFSDSSAHRLVSDISALISTQTLHRVVIAGDFNILRGYGEDGSLYQKARYESVFSRMDALGLPCAGPETPRGRSADPWPSELPSGSRNVPTFRTNRQTVEGATRQLDFVFASKVLLPRLTVSALNGVSEWGGSDHCRVAIELRRVDE